MIPATQFAGDQTSDTVTPGNWWLNRDAQSWGALNGTILMTGKPSDAAAFHTWSPEARRAIRAAGWSYEPRQVTADDRRKPR